MRHALLTAIAALVSIASYAGITTYQFTSIQWASRVGATACDGKTDGWKSDKDASDYSKGYPTDAPYYSIGVSVKTGTSGAGATSIKSFTNVRQITFNFCQNSSKGKGVIYVQVGDNAYDSIVVHKPQTSGSGVYMRDSTIRLTTPQTGKIRFRITCTENAINLNTITIRAEEGGSTPFTESSYQLVTDVKQLKDSDQIIFGVAQSDYIMGYFDEYASKNNIKPLKGVYSSDRQTVRENDAAVYTLWLMEDEQTGDTFYTFVDEIRYEQGFLVASGGQTKNRLAIWNNYTSPTYGDYGVWNIDVSTTGQATIRSMGTSKGKYIQLNAGNADGPIFACYESPNYEPICLYRRVEAIGDKAAIVAPMCNFGTVVLKDDSVTGSKTIMVNANKLSQDISVSLKGNSNIFRINTTTLDRDGDNLTIRFASSAAGKYADTLVFTSGEIETEAVVLLDVQETKHISDVVGLDDYTTVYLDTVVVTKKYDQYIFIQDKTGSMLIYDATNAKTGKPYGQGLKQGDVLTDVAGMYKNYYGVPELSPRQAWSVSKTPVEVQPTIVTEVDSADVCRYVRLEKVFIEDNMLTIGDKDIIVADPFNTGIMPGVTTDLDAIVMWSWNQLELWVIGQRITTSVVSPSTSHLPTGKCYNVLGQEVPSDYRGIIIQDGCKQYVR